MPSLCERPKTYPIISGRFRVAVGFDFLTQPWLHNYLGRFHRQNFNKLLQTAFVLAARLARHFFHALHLFSTYCALETGFSRKETVAAILRRQLAHNLDTRGHKFTTFDRIFTSAWDHSELYAIGPLHKRTNRQHFALTDVRLVICEGKWRTCFAFRLTHRRYLMLECVAKAMCFVAEI